MVQGALMPSPVLAFEYLPEPEPISVEALISQVALEAKVSSTTLYNLVWSESRLDPTRVSETGDYGLVQINLKYNPQVSEEEALDPEFSLRFSADKLKKGKESMWTVCNCYSYASLFVDLPRMAEIQSNSTPHKGAIAIFWYGKVKHVAVVTSTEAGGFWVKEANKSPCLTGSRFVKWGDKNLTGFYSP